MLLDSGMSYFARALGERAIWDKALMELVVDFQSFSGFEETGYRCF